MPGSLASEVPNDMQVKDVPASGIGCAEQLWVLSQNGVQNIAFGSQYESATQSDWRWQSPYRAVIPTARQVNRYMTFCCVEPKAAVTLEQVWLAPQSLLKGVQVGVQVPTVAPPKPPAHA